MIMARQSDATARGFASRLDREVPELMAAENVPGLSLSVIRDGARYWDGTFGVRDCDTRQPVTVDTVFEAASLSKPVFAYGVLQLFQEGILDLDTPLDEVVAEPYVQDDPRSRQITMRHVLSHATGFPNWRSDERPLRTYFAPRHAVFLLRRSVRVPAERCRTGHRAIDCRVPGFARAVAPWVQDGQLPLAVRGRVHGGHAPQQDGGNPREAGGGRTSTPPPACTARPADLQDSSVR
jgi:hypothetical protein